MENSITALVIVVVLGIPYYFHIKRDRPPKRPEVVFAFLWLAMRRVISALGAMVCGLGVFVSGEDLISNGPSLAAFGGVLLFGILVWLCLHVFMYGAGYQRYNFREDKPVHELRKKRYGWRW